MMFKSMNFATSLLLLLLSQNNNFVVNAEKCSKYGPCSRINMIGYLAVQDMGWPSDTMCTANWGWVDDRTSRKYVVLSCEPGHTLIDITTPEKPRAIANLMGENGGIYRWRDVKVYKNHAFIVSDALLSRVQIWDLQAAVDKVYGPPTTTTSSDLSNESNDNTAKQQQDDDEEEEIEDNNNNRRLRKVENEQEESEGRELKGPAIKKVPILKADVVYLGGGIYQSHNIEINPDSGYAYAVGGGNNCMNGLHVINIQDPKNPKFVKCFYDDRSPYIHDAHCRTYTKEHLNGRYAGKEICFAFAVFEVLVIDVTNKNNMNIMSRLRYDGASYVHQGWLTTDRSFLMVDDERDAPGDGIKTFILDVRDLDNVKLAHIHVAVGETFGDHNQYVVPIGEHDYTFQANYQGGLRVLRINRGPVAGLGNDQILNLEEVAYFDANPGNANVMDGVWSVWPFFTEDRLVVMSDMETGFYVVRWDFEDTDPAIPYKAIRGATPSPTAWSNCPQIDNAAECNSRVACMWDWDWQQVVGWKAGCYFAPKGAVKPITPWRAPPGGPSACVRQPAKNCNNYPACNLVGGRCRAFSL